MRSTMENLPPHIRIIIIEDELHNSRLLKDMVQKLRPEWRIEAILESVEDSVNWLNSNQRPDLILMDIQLSDGICFTIFNQIEFHSDLRIIFTTAYDKYAIRAFKVNSIDYLLKPINENELEVALVKFEQLYVDHASNIMLNLDGRMFYENLVSSILNGRKEYRTRFLISGIKEYYRLDTFDIAYIYSDNKITFAVDFKNKAHILDYNLEELESELDPNDFFRANRKIILNVKSVLKVANESGSKLKVTTSPLPDFEIIISRLKARDFKEWLGR